MMRRTNSERAGRERGAGGGGREFGEEPGTAQGGWAEQ